MIIPFEDTVSPDGEWVLLPETIWGDFLFCRRREVMACLKKPERQGRITEGSGHVVSFRFIRWQRPATVIMSFTFNNEDEEWAVDLKRGTAKRRGWGRAIFEPVIQPPP